jgi:hypothetical protein
MRKRLITLLVAGMVAAITVIWLSASAGASTAGARAGYDINTLAGKVASLNGTAGLQIRFSAFLEEEADADDVTAPTPASPITPTFVLSSPLDGSVVQPPDVTVNQDTAAAPQNETAIAVDPNNPSRVVAAANTTSRARGRALSAARRAAPWATPTRARTFPTTAATRGAARAPIPLTSGR